MRCHDRRNRTLLPEKRNPYQSAGRPLHSLHLAGRLRQQGNLQKAIAKGVAFVPGNTFLIDMESPSNILRLNYSASTEDKIREGIRILGDVLHECLD